MCQICLKKRKILRLRLRFSDLKDFVPSELQIALKSFEIGRKLMFCDDSTAGLRLRFFVKSSLLH
jgi:hypothetical protein